MQDTNHGGNADLECTRNFPNRCAFAVTPLDLAIPFRKTFPAHNPSSGFGFVIAINAALPKTTDIAFRIS